MSTTVNFAPSGPNPAIPVDQPIPFPDLSDLFLDPGLTAQAMVHNSVATATAQCRVDNAKLKSDYLNHAWANYVLRMTSGQTLSADLQAPPKPPMGYVVGPPNADGLVAPMVGTTPVCDMPALPTYNGGLTVTTPIQNHISIDWAAWRPGNPWVPANKDDGMPNGLTTPPQIAPDGTVHTYERFSEPMGGLYLQVS